jgi:hypothetical protein
LRTVPASLERRATAVAPQLGDDPGIQTPVLDRIPDFHRHLCTTNRRGLAEWSTAYSLIVHTTASDRWFDAGAFVGRFATWAVVFHRAAPSAAASRAESETSKFAAGAAPNKARPKNA